MRLLMLAFVGLGGLVASNELAHGAIFAEASAATAENGVAGDSEFSFPIAAASVAQTDDAGSQAFGGSEGSLIEGFATVSAHGCAAPNMIKSTGSSTGAGRTTVEDWFTICSPTLPTGTLVDVTFNYAVAASVNAIINEGDGLADGAGAYVQAIISASGPSGQFGEFNGTVSRSGNQIEGISEIVQGGWDGNTHSDSHYVSNFFAVGDTIYLYAFLLATASASADWGQLGDEVFASITDGDSQGSITWGLQATLPGGGGDIGLCSALTGLAPPGLGNGGPDKAIERLPPRPPGVITPEPASIPILASGVVLMIGRRRRPIAGKHLPL